MFSPFSQTQILQQEGRLRTQVDPTDSRNRVNASDLSAFQASGFSQGHSLKYVQAGCEQYQLGKEAYVVPQGQFLLAPNGEKVEVSIAESRRKTQGFCLYFAPELVNEVAQGLQQTGESQLADADSAPAFDWLPGRFESRHHELHLLLRKWKQVFEAEALDHDCFLEMVEAVVGYQLEARGQLQRIGVRKASTAQELLCRLNQGKAFIHDSFAQKITITDMAEVACLSPFHFTRNFKAAFGKSPYQYVQSLRIRKALELLRNSDQSITDIAYVSGFSDIQQFSKAFKLWTGFAPSAHPDFRRI